MMKCLLTLGLLLAFANVAYGQTLDHQADPFAAEAVRPVQVPSGPPVASPEQIAMATAEASHLIAQAEAQRYFENVTEGAEPRVKHRASGAICEFLPGEPSSRIEIIKSNAPPGEDFVCHTQTGRNQPLVLHVARYQPPPTVDGVLADIERSIRDGLVDAKPIRMPRPGPASEFVRMQGQRGDVAVVEEAAAAKSGDWLIVERLTAPQEKAGLAVVRGDSMFMRLVRALALEDVASRPAAQAPFLAVLGEAARKP